jgi:hypothetical protein
MEHTVISSLLALKRLTLAAQDKHAVPLRQGLAELKVDLEQGGTLDKAGQDRFADMEEHGDYLCGIHERMRQMIDDLFRDVSRPSYPAGELLANEPPAFKAQS